MDDQGYQKPQYNFGAASQQLNHSRSQMQFPNRKHSQAASGGSFEKDQEQSFTHNLMGMQSEFAPMTHLKESSNNSRKSRDPSGFGAPM